LAAGFSAGFSALAAGFGAAAADFAFTGEGMTWTRDEVLDAQDGGKTLISNAGIADLYTVFASTDRDRGAKGISCFLVPAGTPGLRFARPQVLSAPHPLGEIAFDGCRLPADALLGEEGRGYGLGLATLDRLRPTVAAAACGMAGRALAEALAHVRRREQFGTPLAKFQLVQQKIARMADLDLEDASAGILALEGERLSHAADQARALESHMGAQDTITISATTLIIILLLVLLIIVVAS